MKLIIRVLALLISLLMALPCLAANEFSTSSYDENMDLIENIGYEEAQYVNGEVIIKIDFNDSTQEMSFCTVYSDDYENLNKRYNAVERGIIYSEPVQSAIDQLNLNLSITEMRLLNCSESNSQDGKYHIGKNENNTFCLKYADNITVFEAIEELSKNKNIFYAEPNYLYELEETYPNEFTQNNIEWYLQAIKAPLAWDISTGSNDITVGIIDTGIDGDHPDLNGNLWVNPYYAPGIGCSKCNRGDDIYGYNFSGAGNNGNPIGWDPTYVGNHGTHVAGIVGAIGNNNLGTCGVNWNVKLAWLGCATEDGMISSSAVIDAIVYAKVHGIQILSASYGGYGYSSALYDEISQFDGLFVASAGNDSWDSDRHTHYPSGYDLPNVISVAATDENNNLASFSNYGKETVDVAAPGVNIYSTIPNGNYTLMSGTSMATPVVSGIAALIMSMHPDYSPSQVKAVICGTVQKTMGKTYNVTYDGGIVDAYAAVSLNSSQIKTVRFNLNYSGGGILSTEYVVSGNRVFEPDTIPIRSGYAFEGWYTSSSGSTRYNFDNPINYNKTIYAKWTQLPANSSYGSIFKDYKFRNEVLTIVNNSDNGNRNAASIVSGDLTFLQSISYLDVSNKGIHDLTGIGCLKGVVTLNCSNNKISTLLLDGFFHNSLEQLDCSNNRIKTINVQNLANLKTLNCENNRIKELVCPSSLLVLNANTNGLTKVIVDNSTQLDTLYANSNWLTVVNTCGLASLDNVDVSYNCMNDKSDVIGYSHWNYPMGVYYNVYSPQYQLSTKFSDVYASSYFRMAVKYVSDHGIMNGTSSTVFSPYNNLTRSQIAVILYRMAEKPDVSGLSIPFTDIPNNASYIDAVKWLYNNGNNPIMAGTSSTHFSPNNNVTREMMAVVLDRYATRKGITLKVIRSYSTFNDHSQISSWAVASVEKMYKAGIINGNNGYYYPTNSIIRADSAIIIRKFDCIRQYT